MLLITSFFEDHKARMEQFSQFSYENTV